jgi:hypothetical protein
MQRASAGSFRGHGAQFRAKITVMRIIIAAVIQFDISVFAFVAAAGTRAAAAAAAAATASAVT